MSPKPLLPANLKELSFLRKIAKALGMKRSASADQVICKIDLLRQQRLAEERTAAARGTVLPPAVDLARLRDELGQVATARPVASAVSPPKTAAIALPEALDALRAAQGLAHDGAAASER